MSGSQLLQVRLFRDSFNTPWGFRLQGGKDLNQPLSVQRVFSNSPAEGELQRGDIIVQIGGKPGADLTHKQAQDCIKFGGGQIQLVIQRPAPGRLQSQSSPAPQIIRTQQPKAPTINKAMPQKAPAPSGFHPKKVTLNKLGGGGPEFGADFTRIAAQRPQSRPIGPQSQMLNKVQESLDNIVLSPRTPESYQQPFFTPQQQQFPQQAPPAPVAQPPKPTPKVPKPFGKHPDACQFGIDYSKIQKRSDTTWTPQKSQPARPVSQEIVQCEPTGYTVNDEKPAWRETLRSSGVRPWDMDVDYMYKKPEVSQAAPQQQAQKPAQAPKIGDRDWNQSAVYRMIQEERTRTTTTYTSPQQPQQPQQYQPAAPPAPKPQPSYQPAAPQPQYNLAGLDDELGVSDF